MEGFSVEEGQMGERSKAATGATILFAVTLIAVGAWIFLGLRGLGAVLAVFGALLLFSVLSSDA